LISKHITLQDHLEPTKVLEKSKLRINHPKTPVALLKGAVSDF